MSTDRSSDITSIFEETLQEASPYEWHNTEENIQEKLVGYERILSHGGIKSKDYKIPYEGNTIMSKENWDNLIDNDKWTELPPYDKKNGNKGVSLMTKKRKDLRSGKEETFTSEIPWYDLSLPPVPTPVIYEKAPWTDEDTSVAIKENPKLKTGVEIYDNVIWNKSTGSPDGKTPEYSQKKGTLTDVRHNIQSKKLEYLIELENGQSVIADTPNHIIFLNWPPSGQYDKSEINAFSPRTLRGTSHEYLLVENPDVAEANNIDISDIIHKYK